MEDLVSGKSEWWAAISWTVHSGPLTHLWDGLMFPREGVRGDVSESVPEYWVY
jgi:hypothetical protein